MSFCSFVLLLQSLAKYMDSGLVKKDAQDQKSSTHTSIGLVVKKYWNKVVQASSTVQHLQSEV